MPIGRAIQRNRRKFGVAPVGQAPPGVEAPEMLAALPGSYGLTGSAAILTKNAPRVLIAAPSTYAVTGAAATFRRARRMPAVGGAYTVTGAAATLTPAGAGAHPIEGFGASTTGGAGGSTIHVTNTNDSGSGSLRAACASGNRTIVFDVSGTIESTDHIYVQSNTTIDFSTAPGSGITIENFGLYIHYVSNVIIKDARVRRMLGETDYIGIYQSNNIVIDHCSVIGAPFTEPGIGENGDGGVDVKGGSYDVTVQWCLLGVAKQSLIGSSDSDELKNTHSITYHHNAYIAVIDFDDVFSTDGGYSDRSPLARRAEGGLTTLLLDFRHNIVAYAFQANATKIGGNGRANIRDNAYIPAPGTSSTHREQSIKLDTGVGDPPLVYTSGNVELGSSPPNLNDNGNQGSAFTAPSLTAFTLQEVFDTVGPRRTRDADEQARLDSIESFAPFT